MASTINAFYSIAESAVIRCEVNDLHLSHQASKIQTVLNVIDFAWTCWSFNNLITELAKRNIVDSRRSLPEAIFCSTALVAIGLVASLIIDPKPKNPKTFLHQDLSTFVPKSYTKAEKKEVSIQFQRPFSQSCAQSLFLSRIFMSAALICTTSYKLTSAINLIAQVYNFHKLSQLTWLKFSVTFNPWFYDKSKKFDKKDIGVVTATFQCQLTPSDDTLKSYFCSSHPMPITTLTKHLSDKFDHFYNPDNFSEKRDGNIHEVKADKSILPGCSQKCTDNFPANGSLKIYVNEFGKLPIKAQIVWQ
ncbi:MAG: hypothetical protein ABSA17_01490 [Rhabdochlamydiaceae bacterium]|jgi:hypothetical protein